MKKVTLGEWGRKLPVGFVEKDKFNREFAFRDLDLGVEREIQKARSKEKLRTNGEVTYLVLAKLLTSLGGVKLDPDKPTETQALLSKCWLADVLYLWAWLRYEACGGDVTIPYPCPNPRCGHIEEPPAHFDLCGFDVHVPESVAELTGMWKLKSPYEIRSQTIGSFKLQPPTWSVYMAADEAEGDFTAKLLLSSICGTDKHDSILLTDQEVNKLKRPDYMGLNGEIDKLVFGPKLVVDHQCTKCNTKGSMFLDWGYDSFFS